MNVRSAVGEGSQVWLPCLAISEPAAEATMLQLGRGETVLMVASDSSRLLRDEEMLAALGYEPVGFAGADLALAACRATPQRFDTLSWAISDQLSHRSIWRPRCRRLPPICRSCWRRNRPKKSALTPWWAQVSQMSCVGR
jgi:hypothetical protein